MFLKLSDEQKKFIDEVSALSGIQKEVLRECWEFTLVRWAEQIASSPAKLVTLEVPFLGKVGIRYQGDIVENSGAVSTEVESFIDLSSQFKKLVGDIEDEGDSVVTDLLKKKIEAALTTLAITDTN